MRAYLRLDPNLRREKRSYPDGAFRAFVEVLCAAEAQPFRGRFESKAILKAMLGPRARWIGYLLEHNDLVLEDSGELAVVGLGTSGARAGVARVTRRSIFRSIAWARANGSS